MAVRSRKTRSKFNPVANHILRTTGNVASKGAESTFNYLITDHSNNSMLETYQNINYSQAKVSLLLRETARSSRLYNTGIIERALGWFASHALYVLDLLWGSMSPILMHLAWSLFSILLIIAFNVIFFGGLYLLLISNVEF